MKPSAAAAVALSLALPAAALALGMESFGNAPLVKQPGWAGGVLGVVNLDSRVYQQWVNGNETFYYSGDARALNAALRAFGKVEAAERRLVLLPGRGQTRSFGGKPVEYGWRLHVPSGIYAAVSGSKHAVLTAYIDASRSRAAVDGVKVKRWLGELEDDSFETRQAASKGLEGLGADAKPMLREALASGPPLEARRRVEALLARLGGPDAGDLEVPGGVTVVTAADLTEAHLEGLKHADPTRCALAVYALEELAPYGDRVVPALAAKLGKDSGEYVRRAAAHTLGRVGAAAKAALPALKENLADPDEGVRSACEAAVGLIEKSKGEPGREAEAARRAAILRDIDELKKARAK